MTFGTSQTSQNRGSKGRFTYLFSGCLKNKGSFMPKMIPFDLNLTSYGKDQSFAENSLFQC